MNKIDIGKTLAVLANVGVLGGLLFVGFQLQQDRNIARASLRQQAVDSDMYWAELVDQNSEVWVKGLAGEPLSPVEQAEFKTLASARESHRWTGYMQAQGLLDFDSGRMVRLWAWELHENPGLQRWWQDYLAESQYINPSPISQWAGDVTSELSRLNGVDKLD